MSVSEPPAMTTTTPIATSGPRMRRPSAGFWFRVVAVCAVLVVSGGVRGWQARRVDAALQLGRQSPFPLEEIPKTLQDWSGVTTEMDEQIVRATGSTDRITRRYVDRRTGVSLDVIVLYGPTSEMFIHAPELCYPKAGFQSFGDVKECSIANGTEKVPFRSLAYTKGEGGNAEIQEIYYAWRYHGRWSTSVRGPKESQRIPGMYKVQVTRRISATESRDYDNPIAAFLEILIPVIERRIAGPQPTPLQSS
jgi:hypothetical protein